VPLLISENPNQRKQKRLREKFVTAGGRQQSSSTIDKWIYCGALAMPFVLNGHVTRNQL
jgi:hypothetical protein